MNRRNCISAWLIISALFISISNCKKNELFQDSFLISFVESDAVPIVSGYKYKIKFELHETAGTGFKIEQISLFIRKGDKVIEQRDYTYDDIFLKPVLKPHEIMVSESLKIETLTTAYGDAALIVVEGTNINGKKISKEATTTFPDMRVFPGIHYFSASDTAIEVLETVELSWSTSNTTDLYITENGKIVFSSLPSSGTRIISPQNRFNNYVLYAVNNEKILKDEVQVRVRIPDYEPKIKYRISGVPSAKQIVFTLGAGHTAKLTNIKLPWTFKVNSIQEGEQASLSAQSNMRRGCIVVEIYKYGKLWKRETGCGEYAQAAASGIF